MRLRDLFQAGSFTGKNRRDALEMAGVVLLFLYLLAGVIYSVVVPPQSRFSDEDEYLQLSYHVVHGPGYSMDGLHLTASRPPGYAYFLAGIRVFGGGFFSFRVAQFLLLGVTILLLTRLCSERKMFGGLLVVTGLIVCYPVLFYVSSTLYPQTLSGFLFILALTLTLVVPRTLVLNLVTGLPYGLLLLVVPTFLFTMVIAVGGACCLKILRWRDALLIVIVASSMVGAWTLRNAVCFHRLVPVASNSGANFLMGNNAQATANQGASNLAIDAYYDQTLALGLDEFQSDHFYRQAALDWIRAHPGDALALYSEKALNFFNVINIYSPQAYSEITPWKQFLMAVTYLVLLGLLSWRLVEIRRFPLTPREKLFLFVYVLTAFTSAIFFTRIRLRLPYDYLIIAVIALHISRHLEIWTTAKRSEDHSAPSRPSLVD